MRQPPPKVITVVVIITIATVARMQQEGVATSHGSALAPNCVKQTNYFTRWPQEDMIVTAMVLKVMADTLAHVAITLGLEPRRLWPLCMGLCRGGNFNGVR